MKKAHWESMVYVATAGPAGHMPYQLEFCSLPTCLITAWMVGCYFLNCRNVSDSHYTEEM